MNTLGIYFGPQLVSLVETKGSKVLNYAQASQTAISSGEAMEEKVPVSEKLIVVLRDELTKSGIEAREASVSISGKDLIVRTFEMPILPRHELDTAVSFEAKKYIPFKIEELISDYQCKIDKVIKKNRVLFVGIKKDTLSNYLHIMGQLGIKVRSIEYSAFSILRLLKLANIKEKGIAGVVNIELAREDEANFVVLEDGFPLFSRDISLISSSDEHAADGQDHQAAVLEKMKREIQISLDYYERKFIGKNISKLFFITDPRNRDAFNGMARELSLGTTFIDVSKHIDKPAPFSLAFAKAYGSSLSKIKISVKIDLFLAKERLLKKVAPETSATLPVVAKFKAELAAAAASLLIILMVFVGGILRISPLESELDNMIRIRSFPPGASADSGEQELTRIRDSYKAKAEAMEEVAKEHVYITPLLNVIPRLIPRGIWLVRISYTNDGVRPECALEGRAYVGNSATEKELINAFRSRLQGDKAVAKYFKEITILSSRHTQLDKMSRTDFVISCQGYEKTGR